MLSCREVQQDGKTIGELEVSVFAASLVIDRDGILAQKACSEVEREARKDVTAVPVQLPGAHGFRAEAIQRTALPYLYVFAMVPQDGIEGGLLIKVRSARPEWPAADHMLQSLRILTRDGIAPANDDAPLLPLIGR